MPVPASVLSNRATPSRGFSVKLLPNPASAPVTNLTWSHSPLRKQEESTDSSRGLAELASGTPIFACVFFPSMPFSITCRREKGERANPILFINWVYLLLYVFDFPCAIIRYSSSTIHYLLSIVHCLLPIFNSPFSIFDSLFSRRIPFATFGWKRLNATEGEWP